MISQFRKHQKILMIVVTIVVIFGVGYYWGGPGSRDRMPTREAYHGKIYGNRVPLATFEREARKAQLAGELGMRDLLEGLAGKNTLSRAEAINNFAWNSMVLAHEADLLQLKPSDREADSDQEVKTAIMALPAFQTADGQFDSTAYTVFVNTQLPKYGFTDSDLNQLVAEEVRMKKIKALLKTTFVVSQAEFLAQYTMEYQVTHASVIHFNTQDLSANVKVSDDDIKNAFEQHLEAYQSAEKRGMKYVSFTLTEDEKKLQGKERIEVLQKLSDSAQNFAQAMLEKGADFDAIAAKSNLKVTVVPPFPADTADEKIVPSEAMIAALGKATTKDPNTDVIAGENGFYVAQLQEIVPSKQLTLAEARPRIIKEISSKRAEEGLSTFARETRNKIDVAMAEGKSFEDAAKAAGQKVEAYPKFSFSEPDMDKPDARWVLFGSQQLKEGELSQFIQTPEGGILIHIDKRDPIDQAKFEKDKALLEPRFADNEVYRVFIEWLRTRHAAADVQDPNAAEQSQQPGSSPAQ